MVAKKKAGERNGVDAAAKHKPAKKIKKVLSKIKKKVVLDGEALAELRKKRKKNLGREVSVELLKKKKKKDVDGERLPKKKRKDLDGEKLTKKIKEKKTKLKKKKNEVLIASNEENEATDAAAGSGEDEAGKPLQGMDKWIAEYNARRPGLAVLQEQLDSFIAEFEEREEQARKEREAAAGGDGWTVVSRQKGKKRTTDAASGVAVGAFAAAAAADAEPKTQTLEDFYKFQKRDAHRNELLQLQLKFQEDKKKIAQMRAARKFRPY